MGKLRWAIGALLTLSLLGIGPVGAAEPDPCTDPDRADFDPTCLPDSVLNHGPLIQVCSFIWIPGLCDVTLWEGPGYSTNVDPSPTQPLAWRVGAVHNHSSYSDGDPTTTGPRDYFNAAKTGHNTADDGGDTGVKLDFLWGSEHTENAQLPVTTAEACLSGVEGFVSCSHVAENDHYWKWPAALRQAREATDATFTGIRGLEWTNDYFNHMNAYFSTNFVNAKVDGSYVTMDFLWDWLRKPVALGGGADALMTFNHPGHMPALTPFDEGTALNQVLAQFPGGGDWNDLAYVPDVDERVAGMEVNGGDDIEWFVKALTKGWHIGPVAAEDEHQREWSTSNDGKTLILTRGRSPRDYYYAFQRHRTIAIREPLVNGAPGSFAQVPRIDYFADATSVDAADAVLLGSTITGGTRHRLRVRATGLPAGARLALVTNRGRGQASPVQLGAANSSGAAAFRADVPTPSTGEDWWFVVICSAGAVNCGSDQNYLAVTAPIWIKK